MNLLKEITFWIVFGIGMAALIILFFWILDKLLKRTLLYFGIYSDFIKFMLDKRKKKKDVVKPSVKTKRTDS